MLLVIAAKNYQKSWVGNFLGTYLLIKQVNIFNII